MKVTSNGQYRPKVIACIEGPAVVRRNLGHLKQQSDFNAHALRSSAPGGGSARRNLMPSNQGEAAPALRLMAPLVRQSESAATFSTDCRLTAARRRVLSPAQSPTYRKPFPSYCPAHKRLSAATHMDYSSIRLAVIESSVRDG